MRERERSTEMLPIGLHSGCGPQRTPPRKEAVALPGPQARCGVSPVRAHASESCLQPGPLSQRAEPACCARASVTTPSRSPGPSLFRPHCLQCYDNSGFLRGDPSFGDSRSCLRGNTGSWLVSFFNLVPSSESPASPRRPGVLTGTLLDMTL